MRRLIVAVIVFAGLTATAQAETWFSELELMTDQSAPSCVGLATEHWQLSLSDSTLSGGYLTGGTLFAIEVAADGSVDAAVKLPVASTLEKLSGNAARHELYLTNTKYACTWKFAPRDDSDGKTPAP